MRHLWSSLARSRHQRNSSTTPGQSSSPVSATPARSLPALEILEERNIPSVGTGTGLLAQYYNDYFLSHLVLTRIDPTVNLNSTVQATPAPGLPSLRFSVRWTGQIQAQVSETYTFSTLSDDGVRLTINGQRIINDWTEHPPRWDSGSITLTAGQKYSIELDFFQNIGGFVAQLYWSSPSTPKQLVPMSQFYSGTAPPPPIDWFSQNLHDPGLQNLTRTLDADHQLSRNDMLSLFQEVEQDGQVTATELADLRTIVANASTLGMPDYVHNLAYKVVNFDTANVDYQGQPLGNLTSGATTGTLVKLVNKWFLGLDHPATAAGLTYAPAAGTLFSGVGPFYGDVRQGYVNDCYFLASLAAAAYHDPSALTGMFIDNGDGTFTVRFLNNGVADYVTVDRLLPEGSGGNFYYAGLGGSLSNPNNRLWVALAEKAFVQITESGWTRGSGRPNAYTSINIGWEGSIFPEITGLATRAQALINDSVTHNTILNAVQSGQMICFDSNNTTAPGIVPDHVYVALSFNATTNIVTCYNPWGTLQQLSWAQVTSNFSMWSQTP
jgi:hypothetical protein